MPVRVVLPRNGGNGHARGDRRTDERGGPDILSDEGHRRAPLRETWSLIIEAPFRPGGQTAWVTPVRDRDGAPLELELAWRHPEMKHEADALRARVAWATFGPTPGMV